MIRGKRHKRFRPGSWSCSGSGFRFWFGYWYWSWSGSRPWARFGPRSRSGTGSKLGECND
jgi:hypothetical protein